MKRMRIQAPTVALGAIVLASHAAADVTVVVDNTGGGDYATIQGAVDALIGTTPLTQNVTIQVRDTGIPYARAGLADVNLTNDFSLAFQGTNGRPTVNSVGENGLLLYNNNNVSVENFNFTTTTNGAGYSYIENFGQNGRATNNIFNRATDGGPVGGLLMTDNEWNRNLLVERNYFHGAGTGLVNDTGSSKGGRPLEPIVIRNNIIKNGFAFSIDDPVFGQDGNDFPDPDHPKDGSVYILNNSLRGAGNAVRIGGSHPNYQGFGFVVLNNAIEGLSNPQAYELQGTEAPNGVFDHNIFNALDNLATMTYDEVEPSPLPPVSYPFTEQGLNDLRAFLGGTAFGDEANSFIGDPGYAGPRDSLLSNPSEMDLAALAAAIDAGAPLSYMMPNHMTLGQMLGSLDFFGRPRVTGADIDIGAAEFVPEPGAFALVALAGVGLLRRRGRA